MKAHLCTAYAGEIYGISFFSYFAKHYADKHHSQLWQALIQIEVITGKVLATQLDKEFIILTMQSDELQKKGQEDAKKWINLTWLELVKTLQRWVEPYALKYQQWSENTTVNKPTFALLSYHETAIYQCWQAESQGKPGLPILLDFITKTKTISE